MRLLRKMGKGRYVMNKKTISFLQSDFFFVKEKKMIYKLN